MAKITNTFSKGMIRNPNKIKHDKEFYNFGLNITPNENIVDRTTRVNEHSLTESLRLREGIYNILNVQWLGDNEYVYFINDSDNTFNEIYHVKNDIVTLKYSSLDLNFSKVIRSTYRVDYRGDRLIYFVDGLNKDRVVNIDKINLTDTITTLDLIPYYSETADIDLAVTNGGKLLQGNYVVAASFKDINNIETNIKSISNSVSIGDGNYFENRYTDYTTDAEYFNSKNTSFLNVTGLDNDAQTFKSVKVKVRDLINENYVSMNLYLIRYTAEITEVRLLEDFKLSQEFIITGSENFIKLGDMISTVIVNNILYNQSEVITQKDNRLIRANTKVDSFNKGFQLFANNIDVEFIVDSVKGMQGQTTDRVKYEQPRSIGNKGFNHYTSTILLQTSSPDYLANNDDKLWKSFSRDEVYALGVYFELEGGTLTDVYHIPGRLPNRNVGSGETEMWYDPDQPLDTHPVTVDGVTKPRWKVNNTSILTSVGRGALGYYRTDEVYPDGYGFPVNGEVDSNGKAYIRHHRIPSDLLVPLTTNLTLRQTETSTFDIYRNFIGLRFNYTIPPAYQDVIKKVYFTYVAKNDNNKDVLGKGISYILNDNRQSDQLNRFASITHTTNGYEFYSPEVLFKHKQSNISAKRIKTTSILQGVVRYISKIFWDKYSNSDPAIPQYAAYLNSEGANLKGIGDGQSVDTYNYKQLVRFNNVFYNKKINFDKNDNVLLSLDDIKFVDANSIINTSGNAINLAGGQNTAFYKLKENNLTYLKLDIQKYVFEMQSGNLNLMSKLMLNYPVHFDYNWNANLSLLQSQTYYDSVGFSTLLADNPNIDSDLVHLEYEISYSKNDLLQGDSYIEVLNGKRGYSSLISSGINVNAPESSTEFILTHQDGSSIVPNLQTTIDTLGYEDSFSFFTESQLNIRMRTYTQERDYYPHNTLNVSNLANMFEKQVGKQDYYFIDEGYNQNNITKYGANDIKLSDEFIGQRRLETRIVYSEVQNNESRVDNFRTALANNYRDIITTRGGISNMFTKQDNLYAITRDSLFSVYTSNQAIKTQSGDNIAIGTGEFFGIEPSEVLAIDGGIGGSSSKLSLTESPYGYLYVDNIKNKVLLFNDNITDLNELGLSEDFTLEIIKQFPTLLDRFDDVPSGYGLLSGYDPLLKRLFISKLDYKALESVVTDFTNGVIISKDGRLFNNTTNEYLDFKNPDLFENKSITLTYDPLTKNWISYHDYFPSYYIPHSNEVKLYTDTINEFGSNYCDRFILEVLFNDAPLEAKVFDSVEVEVISEDIDGNPTNDFYQEMVAYTENQSTGLVSFNSTPFTGNLTKKEKIWKFNQLVDKSVHTANKKLFVKDWDSVKNQYYIDKVINPSSLDQTKPWHQKSRLRDRFMSLRLYGNNLNNRKIITNFVNCNIRQSIR